MTAKEFLNQPRDEYETCDRIYSPYHIEAMEQYANQKAIEELESLVDSLDGPWNRDVLRRRIKELKQE